MVMDGAHSSMSDLPRAPRLRRRAGWGDAEERLLAGDASFRKYYRLTRPGGTAVVMDAPAPHEDVRPFVRIGRHLLALGLSAPEILAEDAANGFLLLEDLGDDTFARVLAAGGDEAELYCPRHRRAGGAVHGAPDQALLPGLGGYAGEALIDAAMLLPEWYLPEASGRATTAETRPRLSRGLARLPRRPAADAGTLAAARLSTRTICCGCPQRPGVRACGLLDFQDAQRGHPSYDLVSLIEDARRDVAPAVHVGLPRALPRRDRPRRPQDFRTGFALMAAQRHARIIGLFVRLLRRDGKPEYLPHLPRVWRMFERALEHEALDAVAPLGRPPPAAAVCGASGRARDPSRP